LPRRDDHGKGMEILREENLRLRHAVDELSVLNDLAREIGASLDPAHVMKSVVRRSVQAVGCAEGVITLLDSDPQLVPRGRTLVRASVSTTHRAAFHMKDAVLGWMMLNQHPLVVNQPREDARFSRVEWGDAVSSVLCVPLHVKARLIGVLTLYNARSPDGFSEGDQRLLSIIAAQSAQVIENARLYEEEKVLEDMRRELWLATEIQASLLPCAPPAVPGYDIAGSGIPAREVGGDYFDFIPARDDRLVVCLGDVSGKGLPAALLMANLQATVRGQALVDPTPSRCLGQVNTLLCRSTAPDRFATCFYGLLDPRRHVLSYGSGGHERPILATADGRLERLETADLLLSFVEGISFSEGEVSLEPGDTIVAYSDGITEALNASDEEFGETRLVDLVTSHPRDSSRSLIDDVIAEVRKHSEGREQSDDMTVVVLRRLP
jgi:sigma-B regulation protein RsbU (phosphoserine phosphatase)